MATNTVRLGLGTIVRNHDWSSAGDDERTAPRKWASSHFESCQQCDGARSRARGMAARIARRLPLKYEGAGNVRCIVAPLSLPSSLTKLRRTSRSSGLYQPGSRRHASTALLLRRPLKSRPHSIVVLARESSVGGISTASALAVLRLMISSNSVGCSTGISTTLAPRNSFAT